MYHTLCRSKQTHAKFSDHILPYTNVILHKQIYFMPDSLIVSHYNSPKTPIKSALLPKLIVFDLDDTLWIGDVDCTYGPPFTCSTRHVVSCRKRTTLPLHPHVPAILGHLKKSAIPLAIASRTTRPDWARQVLDAVRIEGLSLAELSVHAAWGDCAKTAHFSEIRDVTAVEFPDMIFFDNEMRNITAVKQLGVHCVFCPDGLTNDLFQASLTEFRKNRLCFCWFITFCHIFITLIL